MSLAVITGFIFLSIQTAKGSIEGLVVSTTTNEPIAGAQVTGFKSTGQAGGVTSIGGVGGGSPPVELPPAITDTNGRFVIRDVEPGTYILRASADRYARQQVGPGPRGQTGMNATVSVSAGQSAKDIVFHLMPGGTVSGRVIGENGQPVVNVQVVLFSSFYTLDGQRNLTQTGTALTVGPVSNLMIDLKLLPASAPR